MQNKCDQQNYQECFLNKVNKVLNFKPKSTKQIIKNACNGTDKLNKMAFLSMIGAKKFQKTNQIVSFDEVQKQSVLDILNQNNGNVKLTAKHFNWPISTLKIKLNKWSIQNQTINEDEVASPDVSRRFFENIKNPWDIISFNTKSRNACVEIKTKSGNYLLSQTIPNLKSN